jgi:glycine oxidase
MADVVVIGGGVIGLSIAYELAGSGTKVRLLEQGDFGREASWAGAGILPPGHPEHATAPAAKLRAESHRLWPLWSRQLLETTGIDNGYRACGGIAIDFGDDNIGQSDEIAAWNSEGVEVEPLSSARLAELEPAVNPEVSSAYRLPELCQVRNPRHLKALIAGCAARGVDLVTGSPVVGFERTGDRIVAAKTPETLHTADAFCVAAGAWSSRLMAAVGISTAIEPIRGQIVMLNAQPLPFRHVIEIGPRYLVPRPDGRILIGSTEERAGFQKTNTAAGVTGLLQLAIRVVPSLADATVERCWSGLRPGSADGLPYLDRVPESENLFIAAGHFRSGLQMSPATATLMRELILNEEPSIPREAFACNR